MASLSSSTRIGNTSSSSLIKSANTVANQIATYNDDLAAYTYSISAKTDSDLATYQDYLNGRINTLQDTGTITDANKALNLTKTLTGAISSNTSASIARENIQVMAGNASLTDKYNVIVDQYQRATAIGDDSLAQSLMGQAYSVNQSIQYQAQQASDAAATLAKASASSTAGGEQHVATNLQTALKQLNDDVQAGGKDKFLSTVNAWLNTNGDTLKALGVTIPGSAKNNDATAKYLSIVSGVGAAMVQAHNLAYQAELPYNPDTAQGYLDQATALVNGDTTLKTLAGGMTRDQITTALSNPSEYVYNNSSGALEKSTQSGVQLNTQTGQVTPVYSGSIQKQQLQTAVNQSASNNTQVKVVPTNVLTTLNKLGLQLSDSTNKNPDQGAEVQSTANTPKWLQGIIGSNGTINVYAGHNGSLQFKGSDQGGQAVYTLGQDTTGKYGLYQSDMQGDKLVGGDYGYNANSLNPKSGPRASDGSLLKVLPNGKTDMLGGIFNNPNNLINNSLITQTQTAVANAKAAAAMLASKPVPLPTINVPAPTAAPTPTTQSIAPPSTVSVQKPTVNPQQPASVNLQGGGTNLQGGGGGIRLQ